MLQYSRLWRAGFWRMTIPDNTDPNILLPTLDRQVCCSRAYAPITPIVRLLGRVCAWIRGKNSKGGGDQALHEWLIFKHKNESVDGAVNLLSSVRMKRL